MRPDREILALYLVVALLCFSLAGLLQGCAVLSREPVPVAPTIVSLDSLERAAFAPAYVVISGKPKGNIVIQTGQGHTASNVKQDGPAVAATAPAADVQAKTSQSSGLTPYLVGAAGAAVLALLGWLAFRRR